MLWVVGLFILTCVVLVGAEMRHEDYFDANPELSLKVGLLLVALTVFVALFIGGRI